MRIFLSTGEPSGDLHAANLIHSLKKLRPEIEVVGFGGPKMAEAGGRVLYPLVELAVMWFLRVLLNLDKFFKLLDDAEAEFVANRPDAVVLIDYPGFHWHLAKRAKKHGIPVFYYVPRRSGPGPAGGSRRSRRRSTTSCAACRSSPPGTMSAGSPARCTSATLTSTSWPNASSTTGLSPSFPRGRAPWSRSCRVRELRS